MQVPNHVQEHIGTIAKHEQEFLARRSSAERLGDLTAAIVGNLGFVAAHIFFFLFWILANTLDFGCQSRILIPCISMNQQIAAKVGLRDMENSKEIEQLGRNTSIDEVAQDIQRSLSEDL